MNFRPRRACDRKTIGSHLKLYLLTMIFDVSNQEQREIQEKKKRPLEDAADSQEIRMPSKKKKFASGKKKGKKFK